MSGFRSSHRPIPEQAWKFMRHIMFGAMLIGCLAASATAQDGWSLSVGAGMYSENVYPGSDEYYVTPLPSLKATYSRGELSYSLSLLEGIGITYMNRQHGFLGNLTVNAGSRRNSETYSVAGFDIDHSDETRAFLQGTPDLFTQVYVDFLFAYPTPIGMLGASIGYHPTTVEYNRPGIADETRHGLLYSLVYIVQRPISNRVQFTGMSRLEFMNSTYADTWYSVAEATNALDKFDASGGLRDVQYAMQLKYQLTGRTSASLVYQGTVLLGDAEQSPFTVEPVQHTIGLETTIQL